MKWELQRKTIWFTNIPNMNDGMQHLIVKSQIALPINDGMTLDNGRNALKKHRIKVIRGI